MRAGILCSGGVAAAALCTAGLISADFFGRSRPSASTTHPAAVVATQPPPGGVRQIAASTPPATPVPPAPPSIIAPPAESPAPPPRREPPAVQAAALVDTTASIPNATLFVAGVRVALRAEPNTKAQVVERMNSGQRLAELARQGDWVRVRLQPSGVEGWVNGSLTNPKRPD